MRNASLRLKSSEYQRSDLNDGPESHFSLLDLFGNSANHSTSLQEVTQLKDTSEKS